MAILTGEAIKEAVDAGDIHITPYEEENVQPASIDLTLGSGVKTYAEIFPDIAGARPVMPGPLNPKSPLVTYHYSIQDYGFTIWPGVLYLMHTHERIHTNKFVSVLDGKSSIGRLGVVVHLTAGYGDPGFDGQYTLEVTCIHPVILYAGMKIAQMRFHLMHGELNTSYATKGHYVGGDAMGAIPSMAYKQF
jgi:dCTP deaminase